MSATGVFKTSQFKTEQYRNQVCIGDVVCFVDDHAASAEAHNKRFSASHAASVSFTPSEGGKTAVKEVSIHK